MKLNEKIHAAWKECGYVQKNGEMKNSSGKVDWKYATAEEIVETVRKSLVNNGVFTTITTTKIEELEGFTTKYGAKWYRFLVTIKLTLRDSESNEYIDGEFTGMGQDAGDKAISKGYTFALKHALRQMFLIETGEDDPDKTTPPETTENKTQPITQPKVELSTAEYKTFFMSLPDDVKEFMRKFTGKGEASAFAKENQYNVDKMRAAIPKKDFGADLNSENADLEKINEIFGGNE